MTNRIQLRRDTATNWTNANPVLLAGEVGVDLTNKKIKLGDGTPTPVIVTDNAAIDYFGQSCRQLSLNVNDLTIRAGNDATFYWYQAP
jgi:hypothetical protein